MPRKSKATTQYRTMHPLIFFTKYDQDVKICFGAEVAVPVSSLLTVIGGGPERPLCKVQVLGRTVYGYICPERHEAIKEQADTRQIFAQQEEKGGAH